MADAIIVKIEIFDESLYRARGDVNKWCAKITDRFLREAKHYAPSRSGEMRSLMFARTHQTGIREVTGAYYSPAPHTLYVLRGTHGPIRTTRGFADPEGATHLVWGYKTREGKVTRTRPYPGARREQIVTRTKGHWMPLPAHDGFRKGFASQVSGQRANNFLLKAWKATARDHRSIRGPRIPLGILDP